MSSQLCAGTSRTTTKAVILLHSDALPVSDTAAAAFRAASAIYLAGERHPRPSLCSARQAAARSPGRNQPVRGTNPRMGRGFVDDSPWR